MLLVQEDGLILAANQPAKESFVALEVPLEGQFLDDLCPERQAVAYLESCSGSKRLVPGSLRLRTGGETITEFRCHGALMTPRTEQVKATLMVRIKPESASSSVTLLNQKISEQDRDIARRIRTEQALRRSEEQLRNEREWLRVTLISIGDAVIATDADGCVTFMNPIAETLTGWSEAESRGKSLNEVFQIVNEMTQQPVDTPVARVLREGVVVGLANHTELISRSGTHVPIDDTAATIQDASGKILGVVLVFHDITGRRRAERERSEILAAERKARREAETANRLKDEFLATVSHELRTPLNAILGWATVLRDKGSDPTKLGRGLETIERNAKAQAKLIDDVLDVSRIISGKLRLNLKRVDVAPIILAALDAVRPAAETKRIHVEVSLDSEAGVIVGDADRIQQILWNLLSNAVKFTPSDGRVEVEVERTDSGVAIKVADSGRGIPANFLPHVFERFRQEDSSTTRIYGGLGLGLAIVRHLVELHGGTVNAESPGEGKGATFTVSLPVQARVESEELGSAQSGRREPAAPRSTTLAGLRVLVVDDEADARELVALVLEHAGAEVKVAASAEEALESIAAQQPDVLVSDLAMPRIDGYDLIQRVRGLTPERGGRIPAVALTAYARAEDARRVFLAGFQVHVPKPVEAEALIEAVGHLRSANKL